ncbi:MAG TPA: hypothetical protein DDY49_08360 [Paenibacillaceae bacterium]|nr:hypothetical protein [Paenibacillaceae bacterium]
MIGLDFILLILFICLTIGIITVGLLIWKGIIEKSPNFISRILFGLLFGFILFIIITFPSIVLYGVILWIHSFNSTFVLFDSKMNLYLFSLMVSILAFIYMFIFVMLLKIAVIKYGFKPMFSMIAEFILEFSALYLSLSYLSNEVFNTIDLSLTGKIVITVLFTLIFSGMENLMNQIDILQKNKRENPRLS